MKTRIGQQSESLACEYLQAQGLLLIQRNFRCYFGEIDLIMKDKQDIVFIEVRSRQSVEYGYADESVTPKKMKKIITTANYFLQKHNYLNKINGRFDIIAIHPIKGIKQLEWIKDAFT